ncbi:hypothetical protein Zmor_017972 [Zophobas morio]|uniref:Uncharacterized protein n=1 Tax=Zophobas morio TaxID=2755281 RepID=A0AA38MD81_9CUCU|nr:hypothetical protein Zmor_017972 [Zophobas morio]
MNAACYRYAEFTIRYQLALWPPACDFLRTLSSIPLTGRLPIIVNCSTAIQRLLLRQIDAAVLLLAASLLVWMQSDEVGAVWVHLSEASCVIE